MRRRGFLSGCRRPPSARVLAPILTLLGASIACLGFALSCSPKKPAQAVPMPAKSEAIAVELGQGPLRFLVAAREGLPAALGEVEAQRKYLSAMAKDIAQRLGLKAEISYGSFDPGKPGNVFGAVDVVASFIEDSPALRAEARMLPFFPMPGRVSEGPGVAWWAAAPGRPLLAAAMAQALRGTRVDTGFARSFDETMGQGAAERWFASIRFDGMLRAQYLDLPPEAAAWLAERRAKGGGLRAAVREGGSFSYIPQPDGSVQGFDWDLLVTLSHSIGLPLDLAVEKTIADFFTRDGVMPEDLGKADYTYTPDLLKKVDVYANPWGVTPWRERMMRMVTIYPIRNQLAGRKGEEVTSIKQLDGKRFALVKDSVQQKTLEDFAKANAVKLDFVFDENEDRLYDLVRRREADYVLDGSVIFALNIDKIADFGLSPFFSDFQGVAWAVRKDDKAFASLLETFFESGRQSGLLPALWTKTFKMDFTAYINAMTAAAETGQK